MRIQHSTFSLSTLGGGIFEVVRELSYQFTQMENVKTIVAGPADAGTEKDANQWACPTVPYKTIGPKAFGFSRQLTKIYDDFTPSLSHVHGIWMYYSIANFNYTRQHKIPYLVSPHGMLDAWALSNSRFKKKCAALAFEKRHLRQASCIHALCQSEADSIRSFGLENPICVIPNGVNLPPANAVQTSNKNPTEEKTLLFLGRIHPKKGLENLIQAYSMLPASIRNQWIIQIAGWDQNHQADLTRLAASCGVASRVHFPGPRFGLEKQQMFQQCDAFALPSFSEGLPMSVLEAWSYAKPSIITKACNLPEGTTHEATIQCDAELYSIKEALTSLFNLSDRDRANMGRSAQQLVIEKFTWPHVASQFAEVYHWLHGHSPPPPTVQIG